MQLFTKGVSITNGKMRENYSRISSFGQSAKMSSMPILSVTLVFSDICSSTAIIYLRLQMIRSMLSLQCCNSHTMCSVSLT